MPIAQALRRRAGRAAVAARRNRQKGFTLIELLVVISILGILAAIVTMSMVGITAFARHQAAQAEEQTVQVAFDTMLAEQDVNVGSICSVLPEDSPARTGTDDMSQFPVSTTSAPPASHQMVALYPRFLRERYTHGVYRCVVSTNPDGSISDTGQVEQVSYAP